MKIQAVLAFGYARCESGTAGWENQNSDPPVDPAVVQMLKAKPTLQFANAVEFTNLLIILIQPRMVSPT